MKKIIILLTFLAIITPAHAYNYYGGYKSTYSYGYNSLSSPSSVIFNPAHAINPINVYHPILYGNRSSGHYHKKEKQKCCTGNWILRVCGECKR